jgi:hypothetical protein
MGGIVTEPKLLLNEFQVLYKILKRGLPPWASFLLLGFLVWVEERFIDYRVITTVDKAIEEYETLHLALLKWSSLRRSTRKQEVTSLMR